DLGALRSVVVLNGAAGGDVAEAGAVEDDVAGGAAPGTPDGSVVVGWDAYLGQGERAVTEAERAERAAAVRPDDLSDILYPSGTTGRPKGVMTTHAQTLRLFDEWSRQVTLRTGDRYLLVNPFFHTFGYKAGVLACLLRGVTMVPEAVYDADRV